MIKLYRVYTIIDNNKLLGQVDEDIIIHWFVAEREKKLAIDYDQAISEVDGMPFSKARWKGIKKCNLQHRRNELLFPAEYALQEYFTKSEADTFVKCLVQDIVMYGNKKCVTEQTILPIHVDTLWYGFLLEVDYYDGLLIELAEYSLPFKVWGYLECSQSLKNY